MRFVLLLAVASHVLLPCGGVKKLCILECPGCAVLWLFHGQISLTDYCWRRKHVGRHGCSWPDLRWNLANGLILILFRFILGFSSLTPEKLGCQIYHLAMAAWEQGSARPWEGLFFWFFFLFIAWGFGFFQSVLTMRFLASVVSFAFGFSWCLLAIVLSCFGWFSFVFV